MCVCVCVLYFRLCLRLASFPHSHHLNVFRVLCAYYWCPHRCSTFHITTPLSIMTVVVIIARVSHISCVMPGFKGEQQQQQKTVIRKHRHILKSVQLTLVCLDVMYVYVYVMHIAALALITKCVP